MLHIIEGMELCSFYVKDRNNQINLLETQKNMFACLWKLVASDLGHIVNLSLRV